jgi:subtilisin family serine protease
VLAAALAACSLVAGAAPASRAPGKAPLGDVEVVVALHAPSLVHAAAARQAFHTRTFRGAKLDLQAPASVAYIGRLAAAQRALAARITRAIPSARIRWRYRVLVDGIAVVVPSRDVKRLRSISGVAAVYPSVAYEPGAQPNLRLIGAPQVWGPQLDSAGQGMKIGIIDTGVDQRHAFLSPVGFTMPPGFPKGQRKYTTAKVIVARAFPPPNSTYPGARLPFDPAIDAHGTHVAGIAAGDESTTAVVPGLGTATDLSGVAPEAYIGNYKVLGTPTPEAGPDGNSAEIVAGIEAAVSDGMDVFNLSLGEPEIEPSRDIVTKAIDAAAAAGVVPVVAAGNDSLEFGRGSIDSPGSAAKAITVAAVNMSGRIADFSSSGPAPVSLRMKPDVSAPGVAIASSVSSAQGTWTLLSGTSMAAPHVAGAAAVLRQRHPSWSVAQIKSALVQTGSPAGFTGGEAPTTREGGGVIFLPRADNPLLFASPTGLTFGLMRPDTAVSQTVKLTDAGGGAGAWSATVQQQTSTPGVRITVPATVTVPGGFAVKVTVGTTAAERDLTGFVVLTRGGNRRRIPYWLRVERPRLGLDRHTTLVKTGTYLGDNTGLPGRVSSYRYPDNPAAFGIATVLAGPEEVFRVNLPKPVANFGAAVLSRGTARVHIEPRVVVAGDENRLTGYAGLPVNLNPYLEWWEAAEPVVGAIRPKAGAYDIVFDTPSRAAAGRFTFRFWINDTTPPAVQLLTTTLAAGVPLKLALTDAGSSVDPSSLSATVDGSGHGVSFTGNRAIVRVGSLARGRHTLVFSASDYQEAKNMEDVAAILPNTRVLRTTFTVR